jgi:hypothetical protein
MKLTSTPYNAEDKKMWSCTSTQGRRGNTGEPSGRLRLHNIHPPPTFLKLKLISAVRMLIIYLSMSVRLSVRPSVHHLWLYSPLLCPGRFFSFLIYAQSVGLLGRWMSPSQGRYLHTEQHKHRINAHRHSCFDWDSNPRSQRSSERRHSLP